MLLLCFLVLSMSQDFRLKLTELLLICVKTELSAEVDAIGVNVLCAGCELDVLLGHFLRNDPVFNHSFILKTS